MVKYISFFTINTSYEEEIKILEASLKSFNLPYYFYPVENLGSWRANCHQKIKIIKSALNTFKQSIVYLDSDCVIKKYPEIFYKIEQGYDLGIGKVDFKNKYLAHSLNTYISSVIYCPYKEITFKILDLWEEKDLDFSIHYDDISLERVLNEHPEFKIYILPDNYCQIFDIMRSAGEPVIQLNQASRRFKALIDGGKNGIK